VVLRENGKTPNYLASNPGGRFKGKDPTVAEDVLEAKWIEGAHVIYIGKADNLRRRLRQFADFGAGKPVGHWGGRYIWQIDGSGDFIVSWRRSPEGSSPRDEEIGLLMAFRQGHGGRPPFANLSS
jgi:hypothetical protein